MLAAEAMGELVQALGELDALMRELGAGDEADAQRQLLEEAFGGRRNEWGEIAGGVGDNPSFRNMQ
ncbi:TPA: hypothetical protein RM031_001012 [Salmonella enterica subsp. enterica serovar Typhi]|nr:Type I restriction-modification system [Salmonella enterica subsp. enterica serovar Typhi]HDW6587093.1 hypothetical protein [Salmonella enterica subsp. enterica serovar Typhi]